MLPYELDKQIRMDIASFDDLCQYLELLMRVKTHVPRVHSVTSRRSDGEAEKKANMYYKEIGPSPRCEEKETIAAGETKVRQSDNETERLSALKRKHREKGQENFTNASRREKKRLRSWSIGGGKKRRESMNQVENGVQGSKRAGNFGSRVCM